MMVPEEIAGSSPECNLCLSVLRSPEAPIQLICPALDALLDLQEMDSAKFGKVQE
jgi:hypothetical protein